MVNDAANYDIYYGQSGLADEQSMSILMGIAHFGHN